MELKHRKIRKGLESKGFEFEEGGPHTHFILIVDGVQTDIVTYMSHGNKPINDWLIGKMARQCHLNRRQFIDLVKCPMSEDEYISYLRHENLI